MRARKFLLVWLFVSVWAHRSIHSTTDIAKHIYLIHLYLIHRQQLSRFIVRPSFTMFSVESPPSKDLLSKKTVVELRQICRDLKIQVLLLLQLLSLTHTSTVQYMISLQTVQLSLTDSDYLLFFHIESKRKFQSQS